MCMYLHTYIYIYLEYRAWLKEEDVFEREGEGGRGGAYLHVHFVSGSSAAVRVRGRAARRSRQELRGTCSVSIRTFVPVKRVN